MAQQTIVLDEESSTILAKLLEDGRYPDQETAILEAFRILKTSGADDEERMDLLRWEIEKGVASGIAEGDPFERFRARHGLPARVAQ